MLAFDSKRYVGAQIGIHNPAGQPVGKVSHLRNKEYLFLAGPSAMVRAAVGAVPAGTAHTELV
jgi:adenine-specific DNA-methyltransferase